MFNVGKRIAVLGGCERDNWKWNFIGNEKGKPPFFATFKREHCKDSIDDDGGSERLQQEYNTNPWELCKLYLPDRKRWDQVKIAGFPEMECIAINQGNAGIFVMGRKKGDTEKQGITMGWIREEFSNI